MRSAGFIETEADIRRGVKALRRRCQIMRRIHDIAGEPPLRRRPAGLEGLARIVVGQQLSIASANAIWTRFAASLDTGDARALVRATDVSLRAAGLSGPKIRTLRALGVAVESGALDIDALNRSDDDAVHAALRAVNGIGPWTADIYIMFCLGRADAFAAGDLALQIAAQHAAGLNARPSPAALLELAEQWRPWRGVAARLLWAYYPHARRPAAAAKPDAAPV